MDEERREHVQKMKKMEAEMEQVFEMKVKEKMQKLKDSETDVSSNVPAWCSALCVVFSSSHVYLIAALVYRCRIHRKCALQFL